MILTGQDIGKSLASCVAFPKAGMDYYCATGVFMEYRGMLRNQETQGKRVPRPSLHFPPLTEGGGREYDEVIQSMTDFCERGKMVVLYKPGNCAHGIGHALMILTGHDIEKSLAGCAAFPEAGMDYYCATGVFMECRGMLRNQETQGKRVPRPSLHFPCDTYTQFPAACYRYMLRNIAEELDADSQKLIEECLGLAARQHLTICILIP